MGGFIIRASRGLAPTGIDTSRKVSTLAPSSAPVVVVLSYEIDTSLLWEWNNKKSGAFLYDPPFQLKTTFFLSLEKCWQNEFGRSRAGIKDASTTTTGNCCKKKKRGAGTMREPPT